MNCEITEQTRQPPFQTITVTPKDSKVTLKCWIKTGGNVQDLTRQGLERNFRASEGLYLGPSRTRGQFQICSGQIRLEIGQ